MKPIEVKALPEYKIQALFENNISGVIDLTDFIKKGIFTALQNKDLFGKVHVTSSSIAWSPELEIDALNIYAEILHKQPSALRSSNLLHVAD